MWNHCGRATRRGVASLHCCRKGHTRAQTHNTTTHAAKAIHTTAQRRATANRHCTTDRADLRADRKQRWVNEGGREAGRVKSSIPIWGKVMQCISSHYILLSMSMALPKQVSSLQGLHGVSQVTLAVNRPGIGSGWSQSNDRATTYENIMAEKENSKLILRIVF